MLRETVKYWRTIVIGFVEVAVINSYVLFEEARKKESSGIDRPKTYYHHEFRRRLACQLAEVEERPPIPQYQSGFRQAVRANVSHLPTITQTKRNCKYCYQTDKVDRNTQVKCIGSNVFLHVTDRDCFRHFHQ